MGGAAFVVVAAAGGDCAVWCAVAAAHRLVGIEHQAFIVAVAGVAAGGGRGGGVAANRHRYRARGRGGVFTAAHRAQSLRRARPARLASVVAGDVGGDGRRGAVQPKRADGRVAAAGVDAAQRRYGAIGRPEAKRCRAPKRAGAGTGLAAGGGAVCGGAARGRALVAHSATQSQSGQHRLVRHHAPRQHQRLGAKQRAGF